VVTAFHDGLAAITDVLAHQSAMTLDDLSEHLYVRYAAAGVEHLFSVAAGLDSMAVGEPQILGQLRTAYAGAEQAGTMGRVLHEVVQQALRVGKRVHAETGIDATGPRWSPKPSPRRPPRWLVRTRRVWLVGGRWCSALAPWPRRSCVGPGSPR
jgi:hypothetical protein